MQKNRDGTAVSSRLCSRYAGMGLAVYMNGAKAVETARKNPRKKQNPTHMAWCSHRWSLPLADLPVTIGKDHVVQVAPDPRCRHSAITLLSFIFTPLLYAVSTCFARRKLDVLYKYCAKLLCSFNKFGRIISLAPRRGTGYNKVLMQAR